MNAALNVAIWVSVVFCIIGITVISCWLLLDWQREAQRARAAARMARVYGGDAVSEVAGLVEATEYTWPIVAQQPPVFYEKAVTIPIPGCVLSESGIPVPRHALEEDDDLWPRVDFDREAGLAEWYVLSEQATEIIATIPVHAVRGAHE
jgi:hypothetical protein